MKHFISVQEALETASHHMSLTQPEFVPLAYLSGRVLASDLYARVPSPSVDASLKDGYAVHSGDLTGADPENPVCLQLVGRISAGRGMHHTLSPGQTFRITTGSAVPQGADAVLAEEYAGVDGERVFCRNTAERGRNILARGTDIRPGDRLASSGQTVTPALTGLIATAGLDGAHVHRQPEICVIATGDEVVAPGLPLPEGKLYASNVTEIGAWLQYFGLRFQIAFARDSREEIAAEIRRHLPAADAFITSGGIWGSEKDLMLDVLQRLGWQGLYHRVRMGPGKAVAFGLLAEKPFFCLPGGPASNEMAFLQIALPALLRMTGTRHPPFATMTATLAGEVRGEETWTQFIHALVEKEGTGWRVTPLKQKSRLLSMARKNALITLPEGCAFLPSGASVPVQVLDLQALYTL